MVNVIQNITGVGTSAGDWIPVDLPRMSRQVSIQARTNAVCYYRYRNQLPYWTVKADTVAMIIGKFLPVDIEVQAAAGVIIELEASIYEF